MHRAAVLLAEGRYQRVVELAEPVTRTAGDRLLPGQEAGWLDPHRRAVDATALHATQLVVEAAGRLGDHHRAVETAHRAVSAHPLDESTHRSLIAALDRSGDRAGAVQAYEHCRVLLAEQLGIDPSRETVEVYLTALRDPGAAGAARVPSETSSFVGRESELLALADAVTQPGLVTVTGKGGVGKSRLVMRLAAGAARFPGERLWVSLSAVAEDELVAASVALQLGVRPGSDDPARILGDRLASRGRLLLVLDGCEGVIDGVASVAATVLSIAPMLTVVATSRRRLSIDGERVLNVEPLPVPASGADLTGLLANSQVRLLVDRVRESGGDLGVDEAVAAHLIALCRRCGGLPLALELVAAQLAAMPAGDLLDHVSDIAAGGDDGLRSIALSSYRLLDDDEAVVFRRLAVLDGPIGLPLVREVVSGGSITAVRVVRILRELTARNLLTVDRTGPRWRYEQDDDLHRFARELLVAAGEEHQAYGRLADAVRAQLPDDARATPELFRAEITDMLASVRSLFAAASTGRADPDRGQELAFRLHRYFAATNVDEGRFWLSRLLAAGTTGPWTPYATYALGYLSYWSGDLDDAMRELDRAVRTLDGTRDAYRARALIFLAGLLDDADRGADAVDTLRLAIAAAAPYDVDLQVSAAMGMGSLLGERVDPAAAQYAEDAIELCRRRGSPEQLAMALPTAAMVCWQVGALDQARRFVHEALPLQAGPMRIARVVALSAAAAVALDDGDLDAAFEFGATADHEATELGVEREVPLIRAVLARARLAKHDLVGAAQHSAGALEAAGAMSFEFPAAIGLETAALVLHAAGTAAPGDLACLLDAAADIRRHGDRPAPAGLSPAVADLRFAVLPDGTAPGAAVGGADRPSLRDGSGLAAAMTMALDLLAGVAALADPA